MMSQEHQRPTETLLMKGKVIMLCHYRNFIAFNSPHLAR